MGNYGFWGSEAFKNDDVRIVFLRGCEELHRNAKFNLYKIFYFLLYHLFMHMLKLEQMFLLVENKFWCVKVFYFIIFLFTAVDFIQWLPHSKPPISPNPTANLVCLYMAWLAPFCTRLSQAIAHVINARCKPDAVWTYFMHLAIFLITGQPTWHLFILMIVDRVYICDIYFKI